MAGEPSRARDDPGSVHARALRGVLSLGGREAAGKLIGLAGGIVLARLLEPGAFGLFAMATVAVGLLAFVNDVGLATSLIRQPGEVTRRELDAFYTFQLALVAASAIVLFLAAPAVASWYRVPELAWPVRALTGLLVLRSLRAVPVVLAERRLYYAPVALAELAGQSAYWITAVAAAWAGLAVWSLVLATTALAAVDLVVLWRQTGWAPRLALDWRPLRRHARFGVLYKGHTAAAFAKDALYPTLGGVAFGSTAVGYLTWAQQIAAVPLSLSNTISRVSYPALSQLQHDREAFGLMAATSLRWACRFTFPLLAVLVGLAPAIIDLVYGPRWLPALPALYVLAAEAVLAVGTGLLRTVVYSRDGAAPIFKISLAGMLVTWIAGAAAVAAGMGFAALAAASAAGTALALLSTACAARDHLRGVGVLRAIARPAVCAAAVAIALHLIGAELVRGIGSLAALAVAGAAAGLAANLWEERSGAREALRGLLARPRPSAEGESP